MSMRNAIVVVIDRFGAGYLGPYGNTWIETPALNRLASQSMLWENALADHPTLDEFYRAIAYARHSCCCGPFFGDVSWIERVAAGGVQTTLISDEPRLPASPLAAGFRERHSVAEIVLQEPAAAVEGTQMGHVFAAALECLEQLRPPFLFWLHARGMAGLWDAPREFRQSFADEEDPIPPDFIEPPDRKLPDGTDPDEILGISQAYAGQVLLLDACVATLLQGIETAPWRDETLLILTSPRGYPLGEHGAVGQSGDGLHEEVLHLPLLIRHPNQQFAMRRFQSLVHPADFGANLAAWFQLPLNEATHGCAAPLHSLDNPAQTDSTGREGLLSVFGTERSLRTRSWFLKLTGEAFQQLYVKPDDRWEMNEVADRRADVVEEGGRAVLAWQQWLNSDCRKETPQLPAILTSPAD